MPLKFWVIATENDSLQRMQKFKNAGDSKLPLH